MKNNMHCKIVAVCLVVLLGACSARQKEIKTPACLNHVVSYGDTLAVIAGRYTGNVNNWQKIAKANPQISVRSMAVGSTVCIPYEIVTNPDGKAKVSSWASNKSVGKNDIVKETVSGSTGVGNGATVVDSETQLVRESLGIGVALPNQNALQGSSVITMDSGMVVEQSGQLEEPASDVIDIGTSEKQELLFGEYIAENEDVETTDDELNRTRSDLLREMLQDE